MQSYWFGRDFVVSCCAIVAAKFESLIQQLSRKYTRRLEVVVSAKNFGLLEGLEFGLQFSFLASIGTISMNFGTNPIL